MKMRKKGRNLTTDDSKTQWQTVSGIDRMEFVTLKYNAEKEIFRIAKKGHVAFKPSHHIKFEHITL